MCGGDGTETGSVTKKGKEKSTTSIGGSLILDSGRKSNNPTTK